MLSELKIGIVKTECYRVSRKKYKFMQKYDKNSWFWFLATFYVLPYLCHYAPVGERTQHLWGVPLPVMNNSLFYLVVVSGYYIFYITWNFYCILKAVKFLLFTILNKIYSHLQSYPFRVFPVILIGPPTCSHVGYLGKNTSQSLSHGSVGSRVFRHLLTLHLHCVRKHGFNVNLLKS